MKTIIASLKFLAFTAAFSCLLPNSASASNKPIPGVDIIVRKDEPPFPTLKTSSDKSGKFSFAKLEPGTYAVTINPVKGGAGGIREDDGTILAGTNRCRTSKSMVNGIEVHDLAVTLGTNAASCKIVVGMGGGTISGTVTAAEPAKEPAKTGNKVPVK